MRILVVSQYFWPETFRINEIVEHLTARGHTVTVLTGVPNYPSGRVFEDFARDPSKYATYAGAEIVRVPIVPRGNTKLRLIANYASFALSATMIGSWRLAGRPYDAIFVCQLSPITAALPGVALRRLKSAPMAMWILDLWPETLSALNVVRSERTLGWVSRLVSFIYRRCDRLLVQSTAFKPSVFKHGGAPGAVEYFPAWAEATFEDSGSAVVPAPEMAVYQDTFNVMFAGNIGEAQDLPAVLAAASHLRDRKDIRWILVGDGRAASAVRAEIAARGLEDRVVMLGRFPIERMPEFFAAADALLVTLKSDPVFAMTIPGKIQSYMSAGRPIVAMLEGEGARVLHESEAGLVAAAGDDRGLADRVAQLADMSAEARNRFSVAGRRYCKNEFNRTTLLNRLESILESMATGPRSAAQPHR